MVHQHFYATQDKAPSSPKPQRIRNIPTTLSLSSIQRQNRKRLLKRVRAIWIEGLLEQSLHRAAWIDLHLQEQPDALENPWRLEVQELNHAPHLLPHGTSIVEVYDEADGELLILGEPGAGKTTLLLKLTDTLLDQAEKNERLRIPVVFHLSSWAEKRQSLSKWLIEELWTKYKVSRKIGQDWVNADQVLLLLDGLDEVAKDARDACVQAINAYYQSCLEKGGDSPIVVCCRSKEYSMLPTRLMFHRAVSIQLLTNKQIYAYLEKAGEQVEVFRQALKSDVKLRELSRQPLILNTFILAYQEEISTKGLTGKTREEMQRIIFDRYVERMLHRRGQSECWKPELVIRWLTFLAKQMQHHNQTLFSVEDLQPTWLPRGWRDLYQYCLSIPAMLYLGQIGRIVTGPIGGLILTVLIWLGGTLHTKINPAETLTWSWKKALPALAGGLVGVPLSGLALGLVPETHFGLRARLFIGLVCWLVCWLLCGLSGKRLREDLSLTPNEGIWRSGRNLLVFGLIGGLAEGLAFGLVGGLAGGLLFGLGGALFIWLLFGLTGLPTIGPIGELDAFAKHFFLRFFLWRRGELPWDLFSFLDEAVERLLLRKVGGSYIFVHRLLLDYFATLDKNTQQTRRSYAALLRAMGRDEEAKRLEEEQ